MPNANLSGNTTIVLLAALVLWAQGCQTTTVTNGIIPMPLHPDTVVVPNPGRRVVNARMSNPPSAVARSADPADPCAMRLQDLSTPLLLYYIKYDHLPDKLDDIRAVADPTTDLNFTCPTSGKPYIYNPLGLQAQEGDRLRLILYDATPDPDGCRWGLVMGPTPNRDGRIFYQMVVIRLTPKVFDSFKQLTVPVTQPDAGTNPAPHVQDLGVLHQRPPGQDVQTPPGQ